MNWLCCNSCLDLWDWDLSIARTQEHGVRQSLDKIHPPNLFLLLNFISINFAIVTSSTEIWNINPIIESNIRMTDEMLMKKKSWHHRDFRQMVKIHCGAATFILIFLIRIFFFRYLKYFILILIRYLFIYLFLNANTILCMCRVYEFCIP